MGCSAWKIFYVSPFVNFVSICLDLYTQVQNDLLRKHKFEFSLSATWGHARIPEEKILRSVLTLLSDDSVTYQNLLLVKISWSGGSGNPSTGRLRQGVYQVSNVSLGSIVSFRKA